VLLIDWDQARPGSACLELVTALTNTTNFTPSRMAAFLQGYESVRPFTRPERRLVSALYRFPREAWHLCDQTRRGRGEPLAAILNSSWDSRISAVQWMEEWANT
jgi:Ser/Thr protein kinase RdoA (MazF antagonist)